MSALETDLNPNTYIGLKLPIKNSSNLDFDMTKTSLEQSKFNITNLLLTNTGERVYQPEFGSRLRELIFEQIDENLPNKIEEEVRRAVSRWLPYINISSVETLTNDTDKNQIYVKVKYSTTLNRRTEQEVVIDTTYFETVS
tara:strand:+ start:941 stop:1363 length:423 start_codon:yes stop_codon:yes gene_type:complete